MKKLCFAVLASLILIANLSAVDIFVSTTGSGDFSGRSWSNAINGGNYTVGLNVQNAITAAVANSATEVNVYFAGGTYTTTNQISIVSIKIPVRLSGGYLGTADNSFERSESETVFKRVTYNIRFIRAASLPSLVIEGITFQGGYVAYDAAMGGAIYCDSSTTVISNCVFTSNAYKTTTNDPRKVGKHGGGGAIAAINSGSLLIDNCKFDKNYASNNGGYCCSFGAAVLAYKVNIAVRNSTFTGNYMNGSSGRQTYFGAAIGTEHGNVEIYNCTFTGNYIQGSWYSPGGASGGALSIRNPGTFKMSDSVFTGNYVASGSSTTFPYAAGIILLDDWRTSGGLATSVIERCVFDSRTIPGTISSRPAQSDFLLSGGRLFMTNCLFFAARGNGTYGNYSVRNHGGIAYSGNTSKYYGYDGYSSVTCASSEMELVNCTIADGKGYGVASLGGSLSKMMNSISCGHTVSGAHNVASIEYSCLQEEHEGEGNFVADPLWTGAPYYHLITRAKNGYIQDGWFGGTFAGEKSEVSSPCIDAGAPDFANHIYEPHAKGRRINLGAYGGTPWASKTYYQLGSILKLR